jgi:hypothetical protein
MMKIQTCRQEYMRIDVPDISPCPFCIAEKETDFRLDISPTGSRQVFCRICGARGPYGSDSENAVMKWNGHERELFNRSIPRPKLGDFET